MLTVDQEHLFREAHLKVVKESNSERKIGNDSMKAEEQKRKFYEAKAELL